MRALRYLGPNQLEVQDVPKPVPKPNEVLLKVRDVGICGSDLHGYLGKTGRRIPPMTMGHEFSGEVVELGSEVTKFKVGDGVVVQPINFCGECVNCKEGLTNMCLNRLFFGVLEEDGAMAEYVAVPEKLMYKLPEGYSYEFAATAEPYAVAHGAVAKAGDLKDKNVLIIGAGTIGLCILQLVAIQKPKQIFVSDLSDARLATAKRLGADITINPKNEDYLQVISDHTDTIMVDVSIEAVGVQATANQSIKALRFGGTAVWVGMSQKEMEINMQDVVCLARRILGSFNYTHEEFGEVVDLLVSGKLHPEDLISCVVSLEEAVDMFPKALANPDDYIKVLIDPTK